MSKTYGMLIRNKRETAGLTQAELAEKVGISQKTVSKYENGVEIPKISVLEVIAKALECKITELINI